MAVDMNAAMNAYGVTANLINAIPELSGILQQAVTEGRSQDWVNAEVAQSPWYRTHGDRLRNLIMQAQTDPATYQQTLTNSINHVAQIAHAAGRTFDWNLGYRALVEGADDTTIQGWVGSAGALVQTEPGVYAGQAAQLRDHLVQTASDYGVAYTDQFINGYLDKIQSGYDTIDGFQSLMEARAKAAFPQFADQIAAGQTVRQIADPYMATYAKTLEVPQTAVSLNDPLVKKALSQNVNGVQQAMPLWQFERQLKDDPRYDRTDQARSDAYSTLAQVGRDFGFYKP